MAHLSLLLLILSAASFGGHCSSQNGTRTENNSVPPPAEPSPRFWVLADLVGVRWQHSCISSQLCADPRFSLLTQMPKFNERVAQQWPMAKTAVQDLSLESFTFWQRGVPSDVAVQALVEGTDPKFKFPRVCDESPAVSVFQMDSTGPDQRRVQLQLHGQCFNATLMVQLFLHRCPWCPEEDPKLGANAQHMDSSHFGSLPALELRTNFLILLLAVATTINVLAFLGLLVICLRQCRAEKRDRQRQNGQQTSEDLSQKLFLCSPERGLPRVVHHHNGPNGPNHQRSSAALCSSFAFPTLAPADLQQTPHSRSSLPTIMEEHYEEISDDDLPLPPNIPRHQQLNGNANYSVKVRLPLSRKCDHCFLRREGDDRCSCASLGSSANNSLSECPFNDSFSDVEERGSASFNSSSSSSERIGNAVDSGLDGSSHTTGSP